uniref:MULE domain-containing protein n=1 Tax=Strongyloides papillosus TaxID=174720 RepID=A0A0N5CHK7_STREA
MSDKEIAVLKTFKNICPIKCHKVCLFHFTQSIQRNLKKRGFTTLVQKKSISHNLRSDVNVKELRDIVQIIYLVPHLPESKINEGFEYFIFKLQEYSVGNSYNQGINDFIEYLRNE